MNWTQYPEAIVEWDDAWGDITEFVTMDGIIDSHQPWKVETRGLLLHQDDSGIHLANERVIVDGRERFRGRTFIPKGMIRKITIKKKRERKPKVKEVNDAGPITQ